MMKNNRDKNIQVDRYLNLLTEIPEREATRIIVGREKFLSQAREIAQMERHLIKTVSISPVVRLKNRVNTFLHWIKGKERIMLTSMISLLVTFVLVLGGGSSIVYAAQDSLPGEALYSIKITGENLRIDLTKNTREKIALYLNFGNRRVNEIVELAQIGESIPEGVAIRFGYQLDNLMNFAVGLDDQSMIQALIQICETIQEQERILDGVGRVDQQSEMVLNQIRERLQELAKLSESGQMDPSRFRELIRIRNQNRWNNPTKIPTNTPEGYQYGTRSKPNNLPATGNPGAGGYEPVQPTETPESVGLRPGPVIPTPTPKKAGDGGGGGPIPTSGPSQTQQGLPSPTPKPGNGGSCSSCTSTPGGGGKRSSTTPTPPGGGYTTTKTNTPGDGGQSPGGTPTTGGGGGGCRP